MPVLRLMRAAVFAVVCVTASLGMHLLAGGAAVDPVVPAVAVPPVTAGAFVLARRRRGLGTLLGASFVTQYGLHHLLSASAVERSLITDHQHGGLAAMVAAHAATALLSAYWLERGESALAMLVHLLLASILVLPVRCPPVLRRVPRWVSRDGAPSLVTRLLAAVVSRRGPPVGFSVI
ncbi:hypothetical protein [Planobispora takensis]|uniref:MFS transporter n=1 Tax=Planobispora takensis TaxID=1367882 RepID=A0A8J3T4M0_9ACTN|nr:hypothetical protein [Planobispora takensis]GII05987.1 hypothetical protein Pta02_79950 [Planobispora takensis]